LDLQEIPISNRKKIVYDIVFFNDVYYKRDFKYSHLHDESFRNYLLDITSISKKNIFFNFFDNDSYNFFKTNKKSTFFSLYDKIFFSKLIAQINKKDSSKYTYDIMI